ncbi:Sucraseferredoxin-like protein [Lipomyces oligophaga]|uniref:Sucraseferredoxin-like protein n=1 Tax=Lipomyces oligophaga TaxID=45792 RepID=UPI0034CD7FA1
MGILSGLKNLAKPDTVIRPDLPAVPEDGCPLDCSTCTTKYPRTLKVDRDTPLWGSVKPWKRHIILATGKTDWTHGMDAESPLSKALDSWSPSDSAVGRVLRSNASLPPPQGYFEQPNPSQRLTRMLILPTMYEATNISLSNLDAAADALLSMTSPHQVPQFPGLEIKDSGHKAVILLCSHKTRDKRCGITAPLLRKEFEQSLREHGLNRDANDDRPGGVPIYDVSHVGGHKFAGNVIIYKDTGEGIWMGLVEPKHCQAIVEETILKGRVYPALLRATFASDW